MKKYITLLAPVLLLLLSCVFTRCKKDNNPDKYKIQLLTEKPWKRVKIERRTDPADPWSDVTSTSYACELDNFISYEQNGTYTETEGATKCVSTDPDEVLYGYWHFRNGGTVLHMQVACLLCNTYDAEIETLNESTMVLGYSYPSSNVYLRETMGH